MPQVASDGSYCLHEENLIGINENHADENFPLGAVMLEEILHFVTHSDNEKTSADYSPEFLTSIFQLILERLAHWKTSTKRSGKDFQSVLIKTLWEVIEADIRADRIDGVRE